MPIAEALVAPNVAARGVAASAMAAVLILAGGTLWHVLAFANSDVAWLLTVGEHMLDGQRPYTDIIETNPPGAILLYLPAIALARSLGVASETMAMVFASLACGLCVALSAAILRAGGIVTGAAAGPLLVIATAILVVLPGGSFGQREHVILLAMLPLLCRLAVRREGARTGCGWLGFMAAIGAGLGCAIKPHYGLGLVGPILLLWHRAGWRGIRSAPEIWLAGVVAILLGVLQLAAFPAFGDAVLPLLSRVYLPARMPMMTLLTLPNGSLELSCLGGYAVVRRKGPGRPLQDIAVAASVGLFAAYLIQGKGWPYHGYPAVAMSLLALLTALLGDQGAVRVDRARLRLWRLTACILALVGVPWFSDRLDLDREAPGLKPALAALGPHPRIMSLASDIAVGHPLARQIGGRWVGTMTSAWIALGVARLTKDLDRNGPYGSDLGFEERILASDIDKREPDAILASGDGWARFLEAEPLVRDALAPYRMEGPFGSVMLFTRKDRRAGTDP